MLLRKESCAWDLTEPENKTNRDGKAHIQPFFLLAKLPSAVKPANDVIGYVTRDAGVMCTCLRIPTISFLRNAFEVLKYRQMTSKSVYESILWEMFNINNPA